MPSPGKAAAHDASHWNHPRAAGLVARERLEQHGGGTLSDTELLAFHAGPNGGRTADTVLDVHPPDEA